MQPIFVKLGPVVVASYAAMALLGVLLAMLYSLRACAGRAAGSRVVLVRTAALITGGLIGARANYVLSDPQPFLSDPLEVLRLGRGGFVFLGGLAGALLCEAAMHAVRGAPVAAELDRTAVVLPLAHACGRMGCYLAGCCDGLPCPSPPGLRSAGGVARFPAALAEGLLLLATFAFLHRLGRANRHPGLVLAAYLYVYALIRFPLEFARPESLSERYVFGLTLAQSSLLALLAFAVAWHARALRCGEEGP